MKRQKVPQSLALVPDAGNAQQDDFIFQTVLFPEIAGGGLEDFPVHRVVYHLHRVVPQKALLYPAFQPVGGDDEGHIGNARKQFPLFFVIFPAVVQKNACRISAFLWAVVAAGFPAVTAHIVKIGTVTREAPAVVKCPENGLPAVAQVRKQLSQVNVIAVNIVQPDHVRVVFPDPGKKPPGRPPGAEAGIVQQTAFRPVEPIVHGRTDAHRGNIAAICLFTAKGEHALMPLRHQPTALLRRDAPRAAKAGNGVDEQVFHASRLPML